MPSCLETELVQRKARSVPQKWKPNSMESVFQLQGVVNLANPPSLCT